MAEQIGGAAASGDRDGSPSRATEPDQTLDPRVAGQVLGRVLRGRYRVAEPISGGATGAVYRAVDSNTGRDVALKRSIHPHNDHRFEIEAGLLASLQHPRVARILDHFSDATGQFLVMDLVRGLDLGAVLTQRGAPGLPVDQAIEYVSQACEALQYVHDHQIVHRDVKPQNMILGEEGVVLVDFGIARALTKDEVWGTAGVGTPHFIAPEVYSGGPISARTDVFGVAATLWTLLAGRPPAYADAAPLSGTASGMTPELERTIAAGLEIVPERRVASVAAFAKALGAPLRPGVGISLGVSMEETDAPRSLLEAVAHTAAGVFGAAAASICLIDEVDRRSRVPVGMGCRGARDRRRAAACARRDRRSGGGQRSGGGDPRVRSGPALRGQHRPRHRIRAVHDARGAPSP